MGAAHSAVLERSLDLGKEIGVVVFDYDRLRAIRCDANYPVADNTDDPEAAGLVKVKPVRVGAGPVFRDCLTCAKISVLANTHPGSAPRKRLIDIQPVSGGMHLDLICVSQAIRSNTRAPAVPHDDKPIARCRPVRQGAGFDPCTDGNPHAPGRIGKNEIRRWQRDRIDLGQKCVQVTRGRQPPDAALVTQIGKQEVAALSRKPLRS